MSRNKLSKRLLVLSAAITMMLCQSAFAAEDQVKEEVAEVKWLSYEEFVKLLYSEEFIPYDEEYRKLVLDSLK